jgi:farnesyl-diphosphate farnesyltransferase
MELTLDNLFKITARRFSPASSFMDGNAKNALMIQFCLDRALDEIEDSTLEKKEKVILMDEFVSSVKKERLYRTLKVLDEVKPHLTDPRKAVLFDNFEVVFEQYNWLNDNLKEISIENLDVMKKGMVYFLHVPIKDFRFLNRYCYYVAGTVGEYLTDMIKITEGIELDKEKAIEFGKYLQKANIIKDFKEDGENGRIYWPREVYLKAANGLNGERIAALNLMIDNAKTHEEVTFEYIKEIPFNSGYRKFTTFAALMAKKTLDDMESNEFVFEGSYKIGKADALMTVAKIHVGYYNNKRLERLTQG